MVFIIKKIKNSKLDLAYEKAMQELDSFFQINWKNNCPNLILVEDRKTINALKGKTTENWLVGWTNARDVYLLSPKYFEKESNHKYTEEEYFALIKHELAHSFSNMVSDFTKKPIWLIEGISIFLSGQNNFKSKPKILKSFIGFYDNTQKEVYYESGFAVEFLVIKYGKDKLIELLKNAKRTNTKEEFAILFENVYGFDLVYDNFN